VISSDTPHHRILTLEMTYTEAEARQELLDDLGRAVDKIAVALACLGAAYERLDEHNSEELEEQLFRPVQLAYARARRTHSSFAERYGLPAQSFAPASSGLESQDARALLDHAGEAAREADDAIAALQDSMMPVEVGDPELRAGLSEVRTLLAPLPARAHALVRLVGR
jgi:hypothetical protein